MLKSFWVCRECGTENSESKKDCEACGTTGRFETEPKIPPGESVVDPIVVFNPDPVSPIQPGDLDIIQFLAMLALVGLLFVVVFTLMYGLNNFSVFFNNFNPSNMVVALTSAPIISVTAFRDNDSTVSIVTPEPTWTPKPIITLTPMLLSNCNTDPNFWIGGTAVVDASGPRLVAWTKPGGNVHDSEAEPSMKITFVGGPECVYNSTLSQYVTYWQVQFVNRNRRFVTGWVAESYWEGDYFNRLICHESQPDC